MRTFDPEKWVPAEALAVGLRSIGRGHGVQAEPEDFDEFAERLVRIMEFHGWTLVYNADNPRAQIERKIRDQSVT